MATDQQTNVSPATNEDRAIATITMAFSNDPVARWVLPAGVAAERGEQAQFR